MQQPLDYRNPLAEVRRRPRCRTAAIIAACVILVANGILLAVAASDRSWGAWGIAIMIGPITNGVLLLLSLACIPIVRGGAPAASLWPYLAASVALPLAAVPIDLHHWGNGSARVLALIVLLLVWAYFMVPSANLEQAMRSPS